MKLVDTNVLVYAVDSDSPRHEESHAWLQRALNEPETILLPWLSLIGFIRIASNPRLHRFPLAGREAVQLVEGWLSRPNVLAPEPDARHLRRVQELLVAAGGVGGNLVNDAHLAALALQHEATVVTFDNDFSRFPGVRWESPARP